MFVKRILNPSKRAYSTFKRQIDEQIIKRNKVAIPPEILTYEQVELLCKELIQPEEEEKDFLLDQITNRIVPGVDKTSRLKANFLYDICLDKLHSPLIDKDRAIKLLGSMQGGYSIEALLKLLDNNKLSQLASAELKNNILIFDYFYEIEKLHHQGNSNASDVLKSWANAEWFLNKKPIDEKLTITAFKVNGEINTDDLSPAQDAWSRPDIPLHAISMLKNPRNGIEPDEPFQIGPMKKIQELKSKGHPIAFVGDVVGTGSSRKSATNSILWHFGNDIPFVPNKRNGGICIGNKIAPIFFNTMEDSGALPIEMSVDKINMGDVIDIYPYEGITKRNDTQEVLCNWSLKSNIILDSVRANGRINLIIGKSLTNKAQESLKSFNHTIFIKNEEKELPKKIGFTLAQKIIGRACGKKGVLPNTYCEPVITSVGSQDTTGPMTRDELKDLACLGFSADLVMQSFCHTAAYPKPVDVITHNTLPNFIHNRGGISLRPGDGIIHSWLNRMLLPDTVGTGGDSHTRFPIGISFPAGSGLVAFAAATGTMPLDVPESVRVRFHGKMQPGITLRDIVHSIPYFAMKKGLLTIDKKNKINVFNGRILEIEGLSNLTCEQAFELSDASAERSAAGCTIKLDRKSITEYLESNISLLEWMIREKYQDRNTIERRIKKMEEWLNYPELLEADRNAQYYETIDIILDDIQEPILCAPNDPDHTVLLSEVAGTKIDEVFIGSCMTNIGHFRAAGKLLENCSKKLNTRLWMAPPTKLDEQKLKEEGFYDIYKNTGVRTEMSGCSLCMGKSSKSRR
jgi:aconitate hydratase 2/2-methylisocitrate dehydratase